MIDTQGLFDIHCHILPGVDDGSKSLEMSLQLLKMEYEQGIRNVILTPHFRYDMFEPALDTVKEQFARLLSAVEQEKIDMNLYLGCEIHSSSDMVDCLKKGERLTMAGSRYVLVEFGNADEKSYIRDRVRNLKLNGYLPIIAHVERYQETRKDIHFIEELYENGARMQVNADSICGKDGFFMKRFCKKLMQEDLISFIGSDAHNPKDRAPHMKECYEQIAKIYGNEYADKIMKENPRHIVER